MEEESAKKDQNEASKHTGNMKRYARNQKPRHPHRKDAKFQDSRFRRITRSASQRMEMASSSEGQSDDHATTTADDSPATTANANASRKRRIPYSKKTWQEQKEMHDNEEARARKSEEQERERLQKLPRLDELSQMELEKVRPTAPRNTTQFLITAHEDEDEEEEENKDGFDAHGSMRGQSKELLALRDEIRKGASEGAENVA